MKLQNNAALELDISQLSDSPTKKQYLLNNSLRKYAKPIIFKDTIPEEHIFKNLAKNAKLRPSLKISRFNPKSQSIEKRICKSYIKASIKSSTSEVPTTRFTKVLRINTPTKFRIPKKKKLKPLLRQYIVKNEKIEIEGRPCSKNQRYPYLESKTPEIYNVKNSDYELPSIQVEIKEF